MSNTKRFSFLALVCVAFAGGVLSQEDIAPEIAALAGRDQSAFAAVDSNGSYLWLRYDLGSGVGYDDGFSNLGGFVAFDRDEESLWYMQLNSMITNDAQFALNAGLGRRWLLPGIDRILGAGLWYDLDDRVRTFNQAGLSLEALGERFDVRFNGYYPVRSQRKIVADNSQFEEPAFVGNFISLGTQTQLYEAAMRGWDLEFGTPLPFLRENSPVRVYGGVYQFQVGGSPQAWGPRVRVEANILESFAVAVAVTNDRVFDTTTTFGFTWYFPSGVARTGRSLELVERLNTRVQRNSRIVVAQQTERNDILATIPGTSFAQRVVHVDNTAAGDGDGTVLAPFNSLAAAEAESKATDIIFVRRGDGTSRGMSDGIALKSAQRLLGDGVEHTVSSSQGTFLLPGFSPGALPTISSEDPNTPAITLAQDNEVSGFNITNAAGIGILGILTRNVDINRVNITGSGDVGAIIVNPIGNVRVADSTFNANGLAGLAIANADLTQFNIPNLPQNIPAAASRVTIENVDSSGNGFGSPTSHLAQDLAAIGLDQRFGIGIIQAGEEAIEASLQNVNVQGNDEYGIILATVDLTGSVLASDIVQAVAPARIGPLDVQINNATVSSNDTGVGILSMDTQEMTSVTISASKVSNNPGNGIGLLTSGATGTLSLNVIGNEFIGNSATGIDKAAIGIDHGGAGQLQIRIEGNVIANNSQNGLVVATRNDAGATSMVVTGNNFTDNGSVGHPQAAIGLKHESMSEFRGELIDNKVVGNARTGVGITTGFDSGVMTVTLTENEITGTIAVDNEDAGVGVDHAGTGTLIVRLERNNVLNNQGQGVAFRTNPSAGALQIDAVTNRIVGNGQYGSLQAGFAIEHSGTNDIGVRLTDNDVSTNNAFGVALVNTANGAMDVEISGGQIDSNFAVNANVAAFEAAAGLVARNQGGGTMKVVLDDVSVSNNAAVSAGINANTVEKAAAGIVLQQSGTGTLEVAVRNGVINENSTFLSGTPSDAVMSSGGILAEVTAGTLKLTAIGDGDPTTKEMSGNSGTAIAMRKSGSGRFDLEIDSLDIADVRFGRLEGNNARGQAVVSLDGQSTVSTLTINNSTFDGGVEEFSASSLGVRVLTAIDPMSQVTDQSKLNVSVTGSSFLNERLVLANTNPLELSNASTTEMNIQIGGLGSASLGNLFTEADDETFNNLFIGVESAGTFTAVSVDGNTFANASSALLRSEDTSVLNLTSFQQNQGGVGSSFDFVRLNTSTFTTGTVAGNNPVPSGP